MSSVAGIVPSPKRRKLLNAVTQRYYEQLIEGSGAEGQEYWSSRGFQPDVWRRWRLGFVAHPVPGHEMYEGRIAIPYLTPTGVSGITFRCLHDTCPEWCSTKYLFDGEEQRKLFNTWALVKGPQQVPIVEGEIDAISLTEAGWPSVTPGGIDNWQPWYKYMFDGPDDVPVIGDGDTAGRKLIRNVIKQLRNSRAVFLPPGKDINLIYRLEGPEALRPYVEQMNEED